MNQKVTESMSHLHSELTPIRSCGKKETEKNMRETNLFWVEESYVLREGPVA